MNADTERGLSQLERAVSRLAEAIDEPAENRLAIDGTIHRFEFTIELCWKAMKRLLSSEGIEARTPREVLRAAFQAGWFDDEAAWLSLLDDRNQTSHAYDETMARRIYEDVRRHFPEIQRMARVLRERAPKP